ncbi:MAG: thermonuclease family protein [Polaromonas sp.]
MTTGKHLPNALCVAFAAIASMPSAAAGADISSFAFVQQDGTLRVAGNLIHLYGIYIPPTDQTCYTFIRPVPCGTRASLALDLKISGDFVHCTPRATYPDGSITASCSAGNDDLSAWMLQKGWAVALPDAPFEYAAMERIAQSRGLGIWGTPVDIIRRPRR